MPKKEKLGIRNVLRSIAGWVVLVVFGVLTFIEYGRRTPLGYTPAPIRFVACSSLASVVAVQAATALASGFVVVLWTESLFGRTMSSRTRVSAVVVVGTVLFILSFGGALLLRRRFVGVCA
jgi:hypothetical protein